MQVVINGEAHEIEQGTTLAALVERRGLVGRRFAIEVNQEVVPRSQYAHSTLRASDRVEIVTAIGGG